jgi:hypothetical protein
VTTWWPQLVTPLGETPWGTSIGGPPRGTPLHGPPLGDTTSSTALRGQFGVSQMGATIGETPWWAQLRDATSGENTRATPVGSPSVDPLLCTPHGEQQSCDPPRETHSWNSGYAPTWKPIAGHYSGDGLVLPTW